MTRRFILATLLAAGIGATAVLAAAPAAENPGPMPAGADCMMPHAGMRMMGPGPHMMMLHGGHGASYIDGRMAFLKAELKIRPAQEKVWAAFEAAARQAAAAHGEGMPAPGHAGAALTPPERLEQTETRMTKHLEALRTVKKPMAALYAALDDTQKAAADDLLGGPAMGSMHGRKGGAH